MKPETTATDAKRRVRSWPTAPWVEAELQKMASVLQPGDVIAEVGVGAGSYARSMLASAALRLTLDLPLEQGARPWHWPIASDSVDLLLTVDALHHEADIEAFVEEAARVTRPGKLAVLLLRSRDDLQADGLAQFFPTAVEQSLAELAEVPVLQQLLQKVGLQFESQTTLAGNLSIDETLLRAIAHRELTGLSSMPDEEFDAGVRKMKEAIASGNTAWPTRFTMLLCRKAAPVASAT